MRIGPRMMDLLWIVAHGFDGVAPSQAAAYMRLNYHGGSSNAHGHAVLKRCYRVGLLKPVPGTWPNGAIPVAITEAGREALVS